MKNKSEGRMVQEITSYIVEGIMTNKSKGEIFAGYTALVREFGVTDAGEMIKSFNKIYNKIYGKGARGAANKSRKSVKKPKTLDIFYTPAIIRREFDIYNKSDMINMDVTSYDQIEDKFLEIVNKVWKDDPNDLPTRYLRPILNEGILKLSAGELPPVYYKFKIKDKMLLVDIFVKRMDCIIMDPSVGFNSILDYMSIGNMEIDLEVETMEMLYTSIGSVGKLSYQGTKRFVKIENFDIDVQERLSERFEVIMDDVHQTVGVYSGLFTKVWAIINLSLEYRTIHKPTEQTKTLTSFSSKTYYKKDDTLDKSNKGNNPINIDLNLNLDELEIKEIVKRELGLMEFTLEEWTVRGHYRKLKSGETIYIEPQVRKRDKRLLTSNIGRNNKSEYNINLK